MSSVCVKRSTACSDKHPPIWLTFSPLLPTSGLLAVNPVDMRLRSSIGTVCHGACIAGGHFGTDVVPWRCGRYTCMQMCISSSIGLLCCWCVYLCVCRDKDPAKHQFGMSFDYDKVRGSCSAFVPSFTLFPSLVTPYGHAVPQQQPLYRAACLSVSHWWLQLCRPHQPCLLQFACFLHCSVEQWMLARVKPRSMHLHLKQGSTVGDDLTACG